MMSIVSLSSLLLLSMMMFWTEGYEAVRPRRRSLVTVNLLSPKERKTPHFQEDFFRGLNEKSSYSYSYSSAQKALLQPCNQSKVVDKNDTSDITSENRTEASSTKKQAETLNGTSNGVIQDGSTVMAEESLARSSAATKEIGSKPATSIVAVAVGLGIASLLVASVSLFFARRRWKRNMCEADTVV